MMDIAKLRELLEAATPGPWVDNVGYISSSTAKEFRGCAIVAAPVAAVHDVVDRREQNKANAALIVAAVNALPSLIARLEAAEGLRDTLWLFIGDNNKTHTDSERQAAALAALAHPDFRAQLRKWAAEEMRGLVPERESRETEGASAHNWCRAETLANIERWEKADENE